MHQLLNVDLLSLEVVGHSSKGVKRAEITSADVLHVGNVVIDNLQQPCGLLRNILDDILKSLLVERLRDPAGVDSAHRII